MSGPVDWKATGKACGLEIPAADLEAIGPRLDALEAAFRPFALKLTFGQEPDVTFSADVESSDDSRARSRAAQT